MKTKTKLMLRLKELMKVFFSYFSPLLFNVSIMTK
jgi:hypothetical protein